MGSVVMVMGINGAGKTTMAQKVYPDHHRLNRDEIGGLSADLGDHLGKAIHAGQQNIVLDNTYLTKKSREATIGAAKLAGYNLELVWLKTTLEDAQVNACLRMLERYGRLLSDADIKKEGIKDPNLFPNCALYRAAKMFEAPTLAEGFDKITEVPFSRTWGPEYVNEAYVFDYDDTLRRLPPGHEGEKYPTHTDHVIIMQDRQQCLEYLRKKFPHRKFLGASNQSGIAKGTLTDSTALACFQKTNVLLGFDIEVLYCPHPSGPPSCYCRKPHPGMLVQHIWKHKLNPKKTIFVGDQTTDKTCAKRVGMNYQHESDFFAECMANMAGG
jgi:HAD superfamily hydrolase (TIGR01662 family)